MTMSTLAIALTQPTLVGWLLKATALLILALATTSLLRRASAGTRHVVWLATLAAVLALPMISAWTPIRLAVVPARLLPTLPDVVGPAATMPVESSVPTVQTRTFGPTAASAPSVSRPAPALARTPEHNERPFPVWATVLGVWGGAVVVLLGWLGFGALSVRRIVRTGRPLDERAWTAPLCEIADRLDLDQVPRLLSSSLVEMPFACGVFEPTIVLPASAEQWSDSRRRAVLFHELAHVKRRDLVGHTLGRVACALYWFHPLVWTAARQLRAESERACDDLVLSCGARASDYADHLLDIVISVRHQGAPATAMPMARRRELEGRVLAILDPAITRIGPGRVQSATMFVGIGALALSVAAMTPRVERDARRATPDAQTRIGGSMSAAREQQPTPQPSQGIQSRQPRAGAQSRQSAVNPPSPAPRPMVDANPTPVPAPAPTPAPTITVNQRLTNSANAATQGAVKEAAAAVSAASGKQKGGIDSAKVALLLRVLRSDPDASVRRMAAWGLNEAGDFMGATDALAVAVRSDEDESVREMAAWALADSRREVARRALATALRRDASDNVRETAVWALGNAGLRDEDREIVEQALTSDESENVRESAAWALGYAPRRPAAQALITALGDRSANVRETAAWALAETEDDDAAPAVTAAFKRETNAEVRMAELRALTFMHVDDRSVLDAALSSKDADLRARAVRMLAGSSGSWPEPRPRPRPRPMP
jgi:beta-lactamase regulating signal transducer with metallopeptidase domain/HEAT repeat protein